MIIQKTKSKRFIIERSRWTPPDAEEIEFITVAEQTTNKSGEYVYQKGKVLTIPLDVNVITQIQDALQKEKEKIEEGIPF